MPLNPTSKVTTQGNNRLVTAPAQEPVDIVLLKSQLRITNSAEDAYLAGILIDARKFIEVLTGLAFITQSWKVTMNTWPHGPTQWWDGVRETALGELYGEAQDVVLPAYPLQSITSVTTYDEADAGTVAELSLFFANTTAYPGKMTLRGGGSWPTATRLYNAVEIVYVAGFGDNPTDVDSLAQRAIILMAAYLYQHRGDGCEPLYAYRKSGAAELLSEYTKARI